MVKHYLILYAATLIVMTLLDMLWIGGIAREFYKNRISNLEFHALPAILFYLLYAAGILIFVNGGATNEQWPATLVYGALFGLIAYGTYDLTNLATLKGWSPLLVVVDIGWGMFVTAVAACTGSVIAWWFARA